MLRWQQRKHSIWQWALGGLLLSSALIALLLVRGAPGVEAACSTPANTPKIVTDHPNYFPNQTVQIDGCGFQGYANQTLPIRVTRPDSTVNSATVSVSATGTFTYFYPLDGIEGKYVVRVYDATKTTVLASASFLDGSVNLDQCANGSPKFLDFHCDWQNGDLNGSNSEYGEADMIPYRLFVEKLDPSVSHTIHINHDFTQGGVKAFDFLTTWNNTQTGADPCSGGAAVPSPCPPGALTTFAFPGDPFSPSNKTGLSVDGAIADAGVSRNLTIYNGSITSISAVTHSGPVTGNSDADMLVTFTANACGSPGCESTVELLWGGHIAKSAYWGAGNGAAAITGAPFHMRTQNLDGGGGANQDRSVQLSAVSAPTNTPVTPTSTPVTPVIQASVTSTSTPVTPTSTPVTPINTPVTPTSTPVTPTNTPVPPTSTPVTPVIQASVTSTQPRVTPPVTPPVGGISLDPQLPGSSGSDAGLLAGAMAAALAGAVALGGGVWYARRRRVR
jgi:hypothetical protein